MRPEDFSPGNRRPSHRARVRSRCFNEAGGFLPRKRARAARRTAAGVHRFNEAGGFLPRKHDLRLEHHRRLADPASMRPEDFSPGNEEVMVENAGKLETLQ